MAAAIVAVKGVDRKVGTVRGGTGRGDTRGMEVEDGAFLRTKSWNVAHTSIVATLNLPLIANPQAFSFERLSRFFSFHLPQVAMIY